MLEILLIITLVISIFFDYIRIVQYVNLKKSLDNKNGEEISKRIDELCAKYNMERAKGSFGKYVAEHWDDGRKQN